MFVVSPAGIPTKLEQVHLRRTFEAFDIDCVFDVGANEGQYARMLREDVSYKGAIISFEPVPAAAEKLWSAAEKDSNWHIVQAAVGNEVGTAQLNVMRDTQFSSLLRPCPDELALTGDKNTVAGTVNVCVTTLEAAYAEWKQRLGFEKPF